LRSFWSEEAELWVEEVLLGRPASPGCCYLREFEVTTTQAIAFPCDTATEPAHRRIPPEQTFLLWNLLTATDTDPWIHIDTVERVVPLKNH
jgi:hypothetical protein